MLATGFTLKLVLDMIIIYSLLQFHTNFSKINGYIEDNNNKGIKYPILTSVDENKS